MPNEREARALASGPPIGDQETICIRAWHDLQTCRQIGMGIGPIPWTAIDTWAAFEGLDYEATKILIDVIARLDAEFLEREASRLRVEEQKAKARR